MLASKLASDRLKSSVSALLETAQFLQQLEAEWIQLDLERRDLLKEKEKLNEEKLWLKEEKQKINEAWQQIHHHQHLLQQQQQQQHQPDTLRENDLLSNSNVTISVHNAGEENEESFVDDYKSLFTELLTILKALAVEVTANKAEQIPLEKVNALVHLKGIKEITGKFSKLTGKNEAADAYLQAKLNPTISNLPAAVRSAMEGNYSDLEAILNEIKVHAKTLIDKLKQPTASSIPPAATASAPAGSASQSSAKDRSSELDRKVNQLAALGYTRETAQRALQSSKGDLDQAKLYLKSSGNRTSPSHAVANVPTSPKTAVKAVRKQARVQNQSTPPPKQDPTAGSRDDTDVNKEDARTVQEKRDTFGRSRSQPSVPHFTPNTSPSKPTIPAIRPQERWICYRCKQDNDSTSLKCHMCGSDWMSPEQIEEEEEEDEEMRQSSQKDEKWTCECCNSRNNPTLSNCEICGTKKPTSSSSVPPEETPKKSRSNSFLGSKAKKKIVSQKDAKVQLQYTKNNFY